MKSAWKVLLGKHKLLFSFILLLNLIQVLLVIGSPLLLSILNNGTYASTTADAFIYGGILIAMAIGWAIFSIFTNYVSTIFQTIVESRLQMKIFEKTMFLTYADKQKFSQSILLTTSVKDVEELSKTIIFLTRPVIMGIFYFIGAIALLFVISGNLWQVPLTVVLMALSTIVVFIVVSKFNAKNWNKMRNANDELAKTSLENVNGVKVIRSFLLDAFFLTKLDFKWKDNVSKSIIANRVSKVSIAIVIFIIYIITPVVLIIGICTNSMKATNILSIMQSTNLLVLGIAMIGFGSEQYFRATVSIKRINDLIYYKNKITYKGTKEIVNNNIEFRNVSFRYENSKKWVLKNVSFSIKDTDRVGIIGTTGAGKSTLLKLLMHQLEPTSGGIFVDNIALKEIKKTSLQHAFSVNEQVPSLFYGTIRENILFGLKNISDDQIDQAITIAQAKDFIETKEDKLESMVAQRAQNLSGGQKQRLAMSRALLRDARTLILDDSTSALDMITEKKFLTALKQQTKFKNSIIIAQRISNILDCDKIIVMDKGKIVGIGDNDTLLKTCAIYKDIYQQQINGGSKHESTVSNN
ncbi:ABC transporter ATP-binding protein [Ureaplasma urealyticum]|uniref:ABC transporter ATP-binding protein n=3 Tax=Ureaplasma urealyticum TaxID=2130 RepID=A0AAP9ACS0_UREUR|nr:ABC transporter ATP-binding protein [Ureaplasma urealyticum]ACI59849.1 ABC transporter, ATP-binding protein [Ureaplasma urealyticum serovar 10 str. ATCC 33699]EDT49810.1 ABC transporter, ATP-binding protein [Ureaplasma urealyticum serovar 13 str. ATCC 33698]EDU06503.1 transport ATP-binding protein [Ureaplasma urealyticum serovar 5 str. ATCC 27817]EDU56661.1 transport ATP-binding protein [Ureaplasma urealyticum serovar 7 str. ATCC 27819]EDU67287.1 transport ATP-binding protein [Ureaplasma ur